jgi:hypothetical protein
MKTTLKFISAMLLPLLAIALITGCKKNDVNPGSNNNNSSALCPQILRKG